jgi:hypothetical protein
MNESIQPLEALAGQLAQSCRQLGMENLAHWWGPVTQLLSSISEKDRELVSIGKRPVAFSLRAWELVTRYCKNPAGAEAAAQNARKNRPGHQMKIQGDAFLGKTLASLVYPNEQPMGIVLREYTHQEALLQVQVDAGELRLPQSFPERQLALAEAMAGLAKARPELRPGLHRQGELAIVGGVVPFSPSYRKFGRYTELENRALDSLACIYSRDYPAPLPELLHQCNMGGMADCLSCYGAQHWLKLHEIDELANEVRRRFPIAARIAEMYAQGSQAGWPEPLGPEALAALGEAGAYCLRIGAPWAVANDLQAKTYIQQHVRALLEAGNSIPSQSETLRLLKFVPQEVMQAQMDLAFEGGVGTNFLVEKFIGITPEELDASLADETLQGGPYNFATRNFTVSQRCGVHARKVEAIANAGFMLEHLHNTGHFKLLSTKQLSPEQIQLLHREEGRDTAIIAYYQLSGKDAKKTTEYFGLIPPPPDSYFRSRCAD